MMMYSSTSFLATAILAGTAIDSMELTAILNSPTLLHSSNIVHVTVIAQTVNAITNRPKRVFQIM